MNCIQCIDSDLKAISRYYIIIYKKPEYLIQLIDKTRSSCNCSDCCWNLGKFIWEKMCICNFFCSQSGYKHLSQHSGTRSFGTTHPGQSFFFFLGTFLSVMGFFGQRDRCHSAQLVNILIIQKGSHPSQRTYENNSCFCKVDIRINKVYCY